MPSLPVPEPRNARPVPFRGGGFRPVSRRWVGFAVFAVILVLAEIGTRTGLISELTLPVPSDVVLTFVQLYETGLLWKHLVPSVC